MAKYEQWYESAEEMYVGEMLTMKTISERIPVSVRTLQEWKKKGDWERRRVDRLRERTIAREEAEEFYLMLVRSAKEQLTTTGQVDKTVGALIKGLHSGLLNALEYEQLTAPKPEPSEDGEDKATKRSGLTPETLRKIEEELKLL